MNFDKELCEVLEAQVVNVHEQATDYENTIFLAMYTGIPCGVDTLICRELGGRLTYFRFPWDVIEAAKSFIGYQQFTQRYGFPPEEAGVKRTFDMKPMSYSVVMCKLPHDILVELAYRCLTGEEDV